MIGKGKTGRSRSRERQTRYLSQAIQLEEAVNPHIIRSTMTVVSLAILTFFTWAGFTNVNEVARTPGEVIPHGFQQTVQHLEGGIVRTIDIREGEIVDKGQVLITLSDSAVKDDLERVRSKQLSMDLREEQLRAFTENRMPDFSRFPDATQKMIADQNAFFFAMRNARNKEARIIRDQIGGKKQSLKTLDVDIKTARKNLAIAADVYRRRKILKKKGYASHMKLLEDRKRLNDIQGDLARLENQVRVARTEIEGFEGRLESLFARHRDEANEKLAQLLADKAQNIEIVEKLEERIGRMTIRAPSRGIVKGLMINTVGAVIQSGQTLMEILPLNESLEVQVKISPQDIGFVKVGQKVQVKFSTFDFSRYGSILGKLAHISATTFDGDSGDRHYRGRILLDANYVGDDPSNAILPGMTVMADVITGRKTILEYLLKPIHISLKTAFTER